MGFAIIECFETELEAINYVNSHKNKDRLYIFYEPDVYSDKPYTVNID
jgi:hypothetical protein